MTDLIDARHKLNDAIDYLVYQHSQLAYWQGVRQSNQHIHRLPNQAVNSYAVAQEELHTTGCQTAERRVKAAITAFVKAIRGAK